MTDLKTLDRVQEAVAAFDAGEMTLAVLERVIEASLRSGLVSAADASTALRNAVASGAVPADSLRRLGLSDAAGPRPAEQNRIATAGAKPPSGAAETTFRPAHAAASRSTMPPDRSSTDAAWVDPDLRPSSTEVSIGTLLGGRYLLERVLGEGGMGVVYFASDQEVKGESFAIKVLKPVIREYPEALDLLREEVRRTRSLGHPNIVGVYSLNSDRTNVYMIMEYLEGKTLASLIDDAFGRGMPFTRAWPLIEDMCAALAYAHDQSVIHSDIKTSNVFVTTGGKAKLLDFGIARAARGRSKRFDPGGIGALTPTYASCEMLEGRSPDARDDIYSLACVIYEMLSGKHPFSNRTAVEARDEKRSPAALESLSRSQNAALARALAFDREERTASVESLLAGLAPTVTGSAHAAPQDSSALSRKRASLYAGGALALGVVAIGLWFAWPRHPTASVQQKTEAVQAQTAVSQLMLRIEASQRKIDDRLRDARSAVDRLTDHVNLARNNTEREAVGKQLTDAQAAADAAQTVNTIAEGNIFSVEKLAALRQKQSSGEAALQAGRFDEAAKALGEARRTADDVIAAADALPPAVADQRELGALLDLARGAIESSGGDAGAALTRARATADQAAQALSAGDAVGARKQFGIATADVKQDVQSFLDRVIAELAVIAQKKMADNELDVAQAAISQAEALQKLKVQFQ
ncbi:MAG: protein kinase domain-containing protein [Steroidobacteraceae bacterium]